MKDGTATMERSLLLPGRPQTKPDTITGRCYKRDVTALARRTLRGHHLPLYPSGFTRVQLELYYSQPDAGPGDLIGKPAAWHLEKIPRGDNAANLILTALTGVLYESAAQVEALTVTRTILPREQLIERFGQDCRSGAAVVRYG